MPKHKGLTATHQANYTTQRGRRVRVYISPNTNTPKNVRVSHIRAGGIRKGISLAEARELARPPTSTASKHLAKNGLTVREIVSAVPWDKSRYNQS